MFVIVHTYLGTCADAEIDTSGNINLIGPFGFAVKDYHFVSLEGVSYCTSAIFNSLAPPFGIPPGRIGSPRSPTASRWPLQ